MPVIQHLRVHALLLLLFLCRCSAPVPPDIEDVYAQLPEEIDYNFHVKPILADRCYQCHGPDENTRMAGLRLDIEEEAFARLKSGNRAFVKGNASKSEVYHRILSDNPELIMPPPDSKLTLTNTEKAVIIKWLEQGAEWKQHWSFIDVERPDVPEIKEDWTRNNEIDNFIQDRLVREGMEPNPEADKERLLRRVTMDLSGLPPTIEEIDAFVADTDPDAYEKVVDRLLASEPHAERLSMEWMDVARYSDSHGVSFDGLRTSWPYRDWLIDAFHENMPYDRFITEQVAGDLIENASLQQNIATSFYRLGQLEVSQGSIPEEFRVEYVAERTALTGTAFLGLTVGCARCHDHKFDPISQKEFFQLSAFFNTTEEMGLSPTDHERPPVIYLFDSTETQLLDSLDTEVARQEKKRREAKVKAIGAYADSFDIPENAPEPKWSFNFDTIEKWNKKKPKRKKTDKDKFEEIKITDGDTTAQAKLGVTLVAGKYDSAAYFDDEYDWIALLKVGLFETHEPFSASAWVKTQREGKGPTQTIMGNSKFYTANYRGWDFFLDSTQHLRVRLVHRLPDDFLEVRTTTPVKSNEWAQTGFTYDGSASASGVQVFLNGVPLEMEIVRDDLTRSIYPMDSYTQKQDTTALTIGRSRRIWTFDVGLFEGAIDEVNIFDKQLSGIEMAYLGEASENFTEAQRREHYLLQHPEFNAEKDALAKVQTARRTILDTVQEFMVMREMENPRKTYLLERGVYDQHGEEVGPGTFERVLPFSEDYSRDRLGLAAWLTDEKNPLTSRVAINRYWQMIFGRGLVRTSEDFGIQGDLPTHPELLDWLAAEFVDSGWDLRHMLKLMVMSATYRQSSYTSFEIMDQDPANNFYARSPSYRWPAEFIRDNFLAASGLLVKEIGGEPVKPYQPEGLWKELGEASYQLVKYEHDTLDALYRRSIYTFQRRFMPHPFMSNFDASTREICQVRRNMTNSPLQALTLMNDPQVLEASRILSERVLKASEDTSEQIELGYRLATGITPTDRQVELLKAQFTEALQHFEMHQNEADSLLSIGEKPYDSSLEKNKVAAMAMVANTIFNYDDSYTKR